MKVPALIREAMIALKLDQAALARKMERGEPTVSRWIGGTANPDYESCLLLARALNLPPRVVLEAAGLDAGLLPKVDMAALTPMQRDVLARITRIEDAITATAGLPDDFIATYLRTQLDNTEEEIMATIQMVRELRATQAGQPTPSRIEATNKPRRRVTKRVSGLGSDNVYEVPQDNNDVVPGKKTYPSWQYKSQSVAAMAAEFGLRPALT